MMRFAYVGFTHESGKRCFQFRRVAEIEPISLLTIEVDLALLSRNKLSIQEAPLFCLKMLESTVISEKEVSERFRPYRLVPEDFRSLNMERTGREAELRLRKHASRRRPLGSALPMSLFAANPSKLDRRPQ